jgi:hypothetical protein
VTKEQEVAFWEVAAVSQKIFRASDGQAGGNPKVRVADHSEISPARSISLKGSVLANTEALLESKLSDDALSSIICYFLRGSSAGSTKSIPPGPMN